MFFRYNIKIYARFVLRPKYFNGEKLTMADPNTSQLPDTPVPPPVVKPDTAQKDAEFAKKTKDIVDGFSAPVKDSLKKYGFPFDKLDTLTADDAKSVFDKAIQEKSEAISSIKRNPKLFNRETNQFIGSGAGQNNKLTTELGELESAKTKLGAHLGATNSKSETLGQSINNQLRSDIAERERRAVTHDDQLYSAIREANVHSSVPDFYYFILFFLVGQPSEEMKRLVEERFKIKLANLAELKDLQNRLRASDKKLLDDAKLIDNDKKNKPEDETTLTPTGKTNPDADNKPKVELEVEPNNPNPELKPKVEFEIDQNNVDNAHNKIMETMNENPKIEFTPKQLGDAENVMEQIEGDPDLPIEEKYENFKANVGNNVVKIGSKPPVDHLLRTAGQKVQKEIDHEKQDKNQADNLQHVSLGMKPHGHT